MSVDWRHVCVSTDVIFVDWRHYKDWAVCCHEVVCRLTSCFSTDEITDRDTGTQMTSGTLKEKLQTGTPGHREYKWLPGHRDTTTTGTPGDTGRIYKWRPGHRECSISNHHQQSSRAIIIIMRYRSEYGLFFPWTIICCMFKSR